MTDRTGPGRAEFVLAHPLRVRWGEIDSQGIVFNAHYFSYFDVGTSEYLRAIGYGYPGGLKKHGTDIFAVHAAANFRASAHYDDELNIAARVARIGRTSLEFKLAVFRGPALLVDGALIYVNGEINSKRPMPWPAAFLDHILAYETVPPQQTDG